jgi:hypothetical protein
MGREFSALHGRAQCNVNNLLRSATPPRARSWVLTTAKLARYKSFMD